MVDFQERVFFDESLLENLKVRHDHGRVKHDLAFFFRLIQVCTAKWRRTKDHSQQK